MTLRLPDRLPATSHGHKRDSHEIFADSSDPPLFSSDPPLFSTSIEDYQSPKPKQKRHRTGPWFEMDEAIEFGLKKKRRHPGMRRKTCQRRPLRKFDSGVYMGSDESMLSESSGSISLPELQNPVIRCIPKDEGLDIDDEEVANSISEQCKQSVTSEEYAEDVLLEKAMQLIEDPGGFEGPVFPYWEEQPSNLKWFHHNQKYATEKVLACVDRGTEVLDLSHISLERLRAPTISPLRDYLKQPQRQKAHYPPQYEPLTPSLTLNLSNTNLCAFPPTLTLLNNLEHLFLSNNNLTSLPSGLRLLTKLKSLNIACNQLRYLPYEMLSLNLTVINYHPNPYLEPIDSSGTTVQNGLENGGSKGSLMAKTRLFSLVSYLDINGRALRSSPPRPSQHSSYQPPLTSVPATFPQESYTTPSLLELSLRALLLTPELHQLPFQLPASLSPHLNELLKQLFYLRESGGQECTICGKSFVSPRTEWLEWDFVPGQTPIAFLRQGCSWLCVRDNADETWNEGWGWRTRDVADTQSRTVVPARYRRFVKNAGFN